MGAYDLSLGVLLMGVFLNTLLFGFVTMQFITYYSRNFKDPFWIRLAVATMVVVDTFHSAVVIYMIWEYCVTSFNNPTILNVALWPYTFTPIGTALAAVVTHSFLSYRIYCLDRKPWVLSLLMLGTLTTFATGVACGIKAWLLEDLSKFGALTTLATCWLGLQMILDVVIASGMSYVLWKSKTGSYKMDGVVHRLIGTAIQIGVFCVIFAAGDLISFVVAPQTHFYGMFAIPLGRIYTNTLMNTLNMRSELKETLSENIGMKSVCN
ncbi:hypothetical protein P691DRAFT_818260, partial [Macrolepiota fuliginosa MF-IS2]